MPSSPTKTQLALRALASLTVTCGVTSAALSAEPRRLPAPPSYGNNGPAALSVDDLQELAEATPTYDANGVEVVRDRYPDGKVKIERQVTLDEAGNYVNHGEWKYLDPKGNIAAQGHFEMGKRIGPWMRWHSNRDTPVLNEQPFKSFRGPFLSQANFINDQMDGEWLISDSAKRKCMQISLSGGKRNGTATVWLPNGTIHRQMTYDRGVPTGEVLELDKKTGQVKRSATYVDGRALTTSTQKGRNPKYKKSEEQFLAATTVEKAPDDFWTLTLAKYESEGEDLRHGPSKIWFDNGKIQQEGYYEQGKRHGTFTFYYETGQVAATGEYKDDQPNDIWVWWHGNGQKATVGQYRGGKQVGQWRWWDESGTLVSQSAHDEGPGLAAEPNFDVETGMAPPAEQLR